MNNDNKLEYHLIEYNHSPNIEESYVLLNTIYKNPKISVLNISKGINKPLIIYGAGTLGKMAKKYFDYLNIPILFVSDKDSSKCNNDKFWRTEEILNPKEIPFQVRSRSTVIICNVKTPFIEIKDELSTLGFDNIIPFYDNTILYQDKHPLNNGWITGLLDEKDIKNIKIVLSKLQDDISRAHYLQFIAWHSIREEWYFKDAPILFKEKYFIPEITNVLNSHEKFINIGAYDGEFTNKFIKAVDGKFSLIHSFEPDYKNIDKFLKNVNTNLFNIYLIPIFLGNKNEYRKAFVGIDCLSQISELGNKEVQIYKLDDFNKLNPTIIKIHVEGTENDIFNGGIETIIKNRPILMMTIYHNRDGLWKTPINIINSLKDYIYYFRLHLWNGTSGIIYAIPKERLS